MSYRALAQSVLTQEQIGAGITLPDRDIRKSLDEAVRRGWTEHTRRAARVGILLVSDTVAGLLGIAATINTWALVSGGGIRPIPNPIPLVAMVFCIQPLALRVTRAYGGGRARASLGRISAALVIAALIGWIQARLFGQMSPDLPNKTAYVYSGAIITLFIWLERLAFDQVVKIGFRAGVLQRRIVLVGHREEVEAVQQRIDHDPSSDVRVVGAVSPNRLEDSVVPLDDAMRECRPHGVVIAANLPFEVLERIFVCCFRNGASVSLLPRSLQNLGASYVELRKSGAGVLLQVLPLRFGLPQLAIKRTMDVILTVSALIVIWPVLLAVALAVRLDSKGPVLFRQVRIGVGGRRFRILKFRTMVDGADRQKAQLSHLNEYPDARLFKIKDDPRITRIGRFLRRSSLDELPQLWNVLKGEMSLVGPRPCVPEELEHYSAQHVERLFVLPGVTGPWQVNGRNNLTDFEQVVRLDREYIRSWSLLQDLVILAKTIPTLLGRGAY